MTPKQKLRVFLSRYQAARALKIAAINKLHPDWEEKQVRKLEYYRESQSEKHLKDIAGMLAVSDAQVNMAWLEEQIAERQLQEE